MFLYPHTDEYKLSSSQFVAVDIERRQDVNQIEDYFMISCLSDQREVCLYYCKISTCCKTFGPFILGETLIGFFLSISSQKRSPNFRTMFSQISWNKTFPMLVSFCSKWIRIKKLVTRNLLSHVWLARNSCRLWIEVVFLLCKCWQL